MKRFYCFFLAAFILSIMPAISFGGCPDFIGAWSQGPINTVVAKGTTVIFSNATKLIIIDTQDPVHYKILSETELQSMIVSLFVSKDTLYVGLYRAGIVIMNISDPYHPVQVGAFPDSGESDHTFVAEKTLYLADGEMGMKIIDVHDPAQPIEIGHIDKTSYSVAIEGHYAYVAGDDTWIFDVADPANPLEIGSYPIGGSDIAVDDGYAYLVTGWGGDLVIVDVQDPTQPQFSGSCCAGECAAGVILSGGYAYVAGFGGGLYIINIQDPENPFRVGFFGDSTANIVAVSGQNAFVASLFGGLYILDISQPSLPVNLAHYDVSYLLNRISARGSALYASYGDGFDVLDISNPSHPERIRSLSYPFEDAVFYQSVAYLTVIPLMNIVVMDVSNPLDPLPVTSFGTDMNRIKVSDHFLYACDNLSVLHIYDITIPLSPTEVSSVDLSLISQCDDFLISGNTAYIVDRCKRMITVVDLSDPSNPIVLSTIQAGSPLDVSGSILAASGGKGINLYDVTDPSSPLFLTSLPFRSYPMKVKISGDLALVVDAKFGLIAYDISTPTLPVEMGYFMVSFYAGVMYADDLTLSGDIAALITYGGIYFMDLSDCRSTIPAEPSYLIPISAHAAGAFGSTWRTDLSLLNYGEEEASISIDLLKSGEDNAEPIQKILILQPAESRRIDDAVQDLFQFEGSGGLRIHGFSSGLSISSRTYNNAESGTFGQYVSAVKDYELLTQNEQEILTLLRRDDRYRTNLGFTSVSSQPIRLDVSLYDDECNRLNTREITLKPFENLQINDIYGQFGQSIVTNGYAEVISFSPGSYYTAYASVVDNLSGDAVFLPAFKYNWYAVNQEFPLLLPAAAHAEGAIDTHWRTDLALLNRGPQDVTRVISLLKEGMDNSDPETYMLTIGSYENLLIEDVLMTLFGFEGAGAIVIDSDEDYPSITVAASRTYTDSSMGTYGQFIPGLPYGDLLTQGEKFTLIQLQKDTHYRTNIGFTSLSSIPTSIEVQLYDASGTLLGTLQEQLKPFEYHQDNDVFGKIGVDNIHNAYAVISSTSQDAHYTAYASVIDNQSGDPIFILPNITSQNE